MDDKTASVWKLVLPYVQDSSDNASLSLVCRDLHRMDRETRTSVVIPMCYSTTPARVFRRFPYLHSLTVKGRPPTAMILEYIPDYDLDDWGGYASPWIQAIVARHTSIPINNLHFIRMIVTDADLKNVASCPLTRDIESLKLHYCSGFSTDGLLEIARCCRKLSTLSINSSDITENDGRWLHELALNSTCIENLNYHLSGLEINPADLTLLAQNSPNLLSVDADNVDIPELDEFFSSARFLKEFLGGAFSFDDDPELATRFERIKSLEGFCSIGLWNLRQRELPVLCSLALQLKKLTVVVGLFEQVDHSTLFGSCHNLEEIETVSLIGDGGLQALAQGCKKLRKVRIVNFDNDAENIAMSSRGLESLARACTELEFIDMPLWELTNRCLADVGTLKHLHTLHLSLTKTAASENHLPFDDGVASLLMGCTKLTDLALDLL